MSFPLSREEIDKYTSNLYEKYQFYSSKQNDDKLLSILKANSADSNVNLYSFFGAKVLDILAKEADHTEFFDLETGFVRPKSRSIDGNYYTHRNEIFSVLNEVRYTPDTENILIQICGRVRVLAFLDKWNSNIDCDNLYFEQEISTNYFKECKKYLQGNIKYMRYARLIRACIDSVRVFEKFYRLPTTFEGYRELLHNPLVYVLLEPYNYMIKLSEDESMVIKGKIVEGNIIMF